MIKSLIDINIKTIQKKEILRDYTQKAKFNSNINYEWLAGLIQADGSFVIRSNRSEYVLYISQSISDIQLLYKIKKMLGFGSVRILENKKIGHYVLQKSSFIKLLLINLKGYFISLKKIKYNLFLTYHNLIFLDKNISFINFNNGWLAGFIDGDGSFYASYIKNKNMKCGYQLQIRFAITQKDLYCLKPIAFLFNKKVKYNKKGFYYFIISDSINLNLLINYINEYPLLSKKAISYNKWLKLYNLYSTKDHLLMKPDYLIKSVNDINKLNMHKK